MTAYSGARAFADDGPLQTTAIADATDVPSTAVMVAGIALTPTGSVYLAPWPASRGVYYVGPFAVRSDGALLYDSSGTIVCFAGGIGLTYRGEIVPSTSTPVFTRGPFGVLADGSLCVSDAGAAVVVGAQYQVPGYQFLNSSSTSQAQVPGGAFVDGR
jgi:hypothetical protein